MESCGNYYFQIRKVAGVADGSLDSLPVIDREIGVGVRGYDYRYISRLIGLQIGPLVVVDTIKA